MNILHIIGLIVLYAFLGMSVAGGVKGWFKPDKVNNFWFVALAVVWPVTLGLIVVLAIYGIALLWLDDET